MADSKKKSILIVEDERFLLELYKTRFERDGFDVCIAMSGKNILTAIKNERPNLVLMDLMMPDVNGYEALKLIRKDKECKDVPVIIFSNLVEDSEIQKAFECGADDYVIKSNTTPSEIVHKALKTVSRDRKSKKRTIKVKSSKNKKPA